MKTANLVAYDPYWLSLRLSLQGGWRAYNTAKENIEYLRKYLDDGPTFNRYYQVLNLVNATLRSFKASDWEGREEVEKLVEDFREDVQTVYNRRAFAGETYTPITEEYVLQTWATLDREIRQEILRDLRRRKHMHKGAKRPELEWFVEVVTRSDPEHRHHESAPA